MRRLVFLLVMLWSSGLLAQEIRRPTSEALNAASDCGGSNPTQASAAPNFYDAGGEGTFSSKPAYDSDDANVWITSAKYTGFPAASGSYSTLNLVIYSGCTKTGGSTGSAIQCRMSYSKDNGSSWTLIFNTSSTRALTRDTVTLPTSQDLTQLQVRYCESSYTDSGAGIDKYFTLNGYDIRTEGTLASASVATPTFSPDTGIYNDNQNVTISDSTSGATICYTTDGSTPTANGAGTCTHGSSYGSQVPISISGTVLKAIGSKSGYTDSAAASATYTLTVSPAPTFSPGGGSYSGTQNVTISTTAPGSPTIYYNTTGSPACGTSTLVSGTVPVSTSQTLYALACRTNYNGSSTSSASYTINGAVADPSFNPPAGVYSGSQTVTIVSGTSGAVFCYTTDGSTPTSNGSGTCTHGSTGNTVTISVNGTVLKALGTKSGYTDSSVVGGTYIIALSSQPHVVVSMD